MKCPRCRREIALEATSHSACGWSVRSDTERARCAFDGCPETALYSVARPQGRARLCHRHYMQLAQDDARAFCAEKALSTRAQMIDYAKRFRFGGRLLVEREPGQDDDEAGTDHDQDK